MLSLKSYAERIPVELIHGLRPKVWLCVGPGFAREEIKSVLLLRGAGLVGEAITTLQDVAFKIVASRDRIGSDRVLGPLARQDLLRMLLGESRISARMPELKRLKRQAGFFKKLDHAVQAGRMAFAHPDELGVFRERLAQKLGPGGLRPVQEEIETLALAYEAWLQASSLWDPPLLFREATRLLGEQGWPEGLSKPQAIHLLSHQTPESLERDFCDALARQLDLLRVGPLSDFPAEGMAELASRPQWAWQRWHTLDDAVESMVDALQSAESWEDHAVLIPDSPAIRRSMNRALAERGIPQADPRDPTRIRWDEGIKWAMLPLELVARDYERTTVIAWLRSYFVSESSSVPFFDEFAAWVTEINSRGIRQGLKSFAGGLLSGVHSRLSELQESLGGRKTCEELQEAHLSILRQFAGMDPERAAIVSFFEQVWGEFNQDSVLLSQGAQRRAPSLYWFERLQSRVAESPAPVEPLKPVEGVRVYRLHQAPLAPAKKLWLLGLPPDWLNAEGAGDYWFSEKEREILGAEFSVRSGIQVREERIAALQAWFHGAEQVTILDAQYDQDGRERETLTPLLREWALELEPSEPGSHPRWAASYGALRAVPPQKIELPPIPLTMGGGLPEISATALDRYSRCGFQGLAYHRWRLREVRDPDTELWPEVKGNILHQAVRHLLESRKGESGFGITPSEALDRAWKEKPPNGLFRSKRVEAYVRSRMLLVLEAFCEKEREYLTRSSARTIQLEDLKLRAEFRADEAGFAVVGMPDRIDETDDGLFILDYKSSSSVPNGAEMFEQGYRLQLPFYALAAMRELKKPVLGVQFVELTRKGGRSSGIFFKRYNGKEPGKLTNVRSNSKSLLALEPEEAWAQIEKTLVETGMGYTAGKFEAKPRLSKREKECNLCALGDLCGLRRLSDASSEGEGE